MKKTTRTKATVYTTRGQRAGEFIHIYRDHEGLRWVQYRTDEGTFGALHEEDAEIRKD